jgi:hypothetical protein
MFSAVILPLASAAITGRVLTGDQKPFPHAQVMSSQAGQILSTRTDSQGRFVLPADSESSNDVTVSAGGNSLDLSPLPDMGDIELWPSGTRTLKVKGALSQPSITVVVVVARPLFLHSQAFKDKTSQYSVSLS